MRSDSLQPGGHVIKRGVQNRCKILLDSNNLEKAVSGWTEYRVMDFDVRREYTIIHGDSCHKALCRTCVGRVLW